MLEAKSMECPRKRGNSILLVGHYRLSPLRGAVLADVAAGPVLGDTQVIDQVIDRLAPPGRA
jgi:hypothetical protein